MFGHLIVDCVKGEKLKDKVSSLEVVVVESSNTTEMSKKAKILVNKEPIGLKETCEGVSKDMVETPRNSVRRQEPL